MRHTAKPGLTGLAQVMGRNAITWEEKLSWDLKYIERVTFWGDVKILFQTVAAVFKRSGITDSDFNNGSIESDWTFCYHFNVT